MRMCSIVFVVMIVCGCGTRENPPATVASPSMITMGPLVANLDYANWSRYPIGTAVKIRSVTSRGPVETISIETYQLAQLTDTEVVVERQNTTERNDGSYKAVNPPEMRKYKKSFSLPAGMKQEDFAKPSLKAKSAGNESIEVLGKTYAAEVFTWNDHTEAGDMKVKIWLSDEMPGRVVQQTMEVVGIETKTVEQVIELTIPQK